MECAFLWFEIKVMVLCNVKDIMNCQDMSCNVGLHGDSDIIHVDMDHHSELFMLENNITVDVVHHSLECGW